MSSSKTRRVVRPEVTFSPKPDDPAALRRAVDLMKEVRDGRRRLKLVIGNGVSKLELKKPEEILEAERRSCHDDRELLLKALRGDFHTTVSKRDHHSKLLRLMQMVGAPTFSSREASKIANVAKGGGSLRGELPDKLEGKAKEIENRCLELGQRSADFLKTLWAAYEQARWDTKITKKKKPPAAFMLICMLVANGYVVCITTSNYDCYLSSVLKCSQLAHSENPCLRNAHQWNYDGLLSLRPRGSDILRVWKVFGDLDFARYSCGHIIRLPDKMPVEALSNPDLVQRAHREFGTMSSGAPADGAPYCRPEDHDLRFYGNDAVMAYQPLHLVDFNWPARHRVFGDIIEGAKRDLEEDPDESLVLVLGYSGNRDPIGAQIENLADDVPVIHIMAHSKDYPLVEGQTSHLWDNLEERSLSFRFRDDMTSGHRKDLDRAELMAPLARLMTEAGLTSPQAIQHVQANWFGYWGDTT